MSPLDDGKRALFSTAVRAPGTVVVECERCHGRTRVSLVDLARALLPVNLWLPWRHYSQWARCPSCGRRTWLQVHWFA